MAMTRLIEFETARLRLRQWRRDDRDPFAAMNADSRVMEFFPQVLDRSDSDAVADRIQSHIDERGWGFWAVELKEGREFIGFVGLNIPQSELPVSPCVEIGWRLAFRHWGKGFAVEGAKGALRVGFETLGLAEIVSFTALANLRSRSVMKKLDMHEAPETFEHPQVPQGNPLSEHCLYRLSREQWQTAAS